MPSQEDNEQLAKEYEAEFKESQPGSFRSRVLRKILKGLLFVCRRKKRPGKDDADYSFEVEK